MNCPTDFNLLIDARSIFPVLVSHGRLGRIVWSRGLEKAIEAAPKGHALQNGGAGQATMSSILGSLLGMDFCSYLGFWNVATVIFAAFDVWKVRTRRAICI